MCPRWMRNATRLSRFLDPCRQVRRVAHDRLLARRALAGLVGVAAHDRDGDGVALGHHEAGRRRQLVGDAGRGDAQLAAVEVELALERSQGP